MGNFFSTLNFIEFSLVVTIESIFPLGIFLIVWGNDTLDEALLGGRGALLKRLNHFRLLPFLSAPSNVPQHESLSWCVVSCLEVMNRMPLLVMSFFVVPPRERASKSNRGHISQSRIASHHTITYSEFKWAHGTHVREYATLRKWKKPLSSIFNQLITKPCK